MNSDFPGRAADYAPMGSGAPLDRQYTSALGEAVFEFARLEWLAVQCCDRIRDGSIEELSERTAGRVADTLLHLARGLGASPASEELRQAASEFRAYVGTRNNLLHSKPGFNAEGQERLFRDGDRWTIAELNAVAAAFRKCGAGLQSCFDHL
jgi:hypothetical protein